MGKHCIRETVSMVKNEHSYRDQAIKIVLSENFKNQ